MTISSDPDDKDGFDGLDNMFEQKSKESILRNLEEFTKELNPGARVIVIGASSILLRLPAARVTFDIDILNTIKSNSAIKYDIQIVNEGILFLCPDYEKRLEHVFSKNGVNVYSLGLLDIALVKLGRGMDKDISDIKEILKSGEVPVEVFKEQYKIFRAVYGGSEQIIDDNYWSVTGERFNSGNNRMF